MVKSIVSMLIAATLIVAGGVAERIYLNNTFDELTDTFTALEKRIDDGTCTKSQAAAAQEKWIKEKERLHVFIPHSEIKEVDLWVAECVAYVELKDYAEAADKVYVTLQLFKQIPKTFSVRIENLL